MNLHHALIAFALWGSVGGWNVRAGEIHIGQVTGEVLYSHDGGGTGTQIKPNTEVQPGFVHTGSDGTMYGSAGPGAKFRVAPGSEIEFTGVDGPHNTLHATVSDGKLSAASVAGAGGYELKVPGGRVGIASAVCVLCTHGDSAHVYVAKGDATLYPTQGAYRTRGLLMMARPSIAVLSTNGTLEIQPLTTAAAGAVNCLLSGASPEIAHALQEGLPDPANLPVNPETLKINPAVSETQ
jgi:hypothetical protein